MKFRFGHVFRRPQTIQSSCATPVIAQSISWSGMALPLIACAAIWGIGNASPRAVVWLSVLHGAITTAASGWTILRLLVTLQTRDVVPRKRRLQRPPAGLLMLYSLLILQPSLAVLASMLHGDPTTLFTIPLPSLLPVNQVIAHQIDDLHGYNAILLLLLISPHVIATWGELQRTKTCSISVP